MLLTLPYSFSQLGMVSGVVFQVFYGLVGSWTAYLISVLYIEYRSRKEKEGVNFKNHVIQVYESEQKKLEVKAYVFLKNYTKYMIIIFTSIYLLFENFYKFLILPRIVFYRHIVESKIK